MEKKSKLKTVELQYNGMIIKKDSYDKAYQKILDSLPVNLRSFLTEKKVLKRYLDCSIGRYYSNPLRSLLSIYSDPSAAFAWDLSKEGALFWNNLANEYKENSPKRKFKVVNLYNKRIKIPIEMYDEIYKKVLHSMSAELFVFLTKNKVIKKFINYTIADYYCNQNAPFPLYININTAFDWTGTKEGYDFWNNIYNKRFTKQLTNNF